jgi:UDP-GlcNAc:undecaprenyl-phosphate/decaprenyl-phosphate GlcNAc-1-phosphate transferase
VAASAQMSRRGLATSAALIVGLTLVSERVSFSAVIDKNPLLNKLDALGRREPS